jgi:hypothetical protein
MARCGVWLAPVLVQLELASRQVSIKGVKGGEGRVSYYTWALMLRVHQSALKHGCTIEDISHALDMELCEKTLDPDNDPPTLLIIGPDGAANILELVGAEYAHDMHIWHADRCRPDFLDLLPRTGDSP